MKIFFIATLSVILFQAKLSNGADENLNENILLQPQSLQMIQQLANKTKANVEAGKQYFNELKNQLGENSDLIPWLKKAVAEPQQILSTLEAYTNYLEQNKFLSPGWGATKKLTGMGLYNVGYGFKTLGMLTNIITSSLKATVEAIHDTTGGPVTKASVDLLQSFKNLFVDNVENFGDTIENKGNEWTGGMYDKKPVDTQQLPSQGSDKKNSVGNIY